MCGIAGLISLDRSPVEADVLSRMAAALAHRGPDEQTIWIDPERPWAGLAHARLVVLDREGGRQPMGQLDHPGRPTMQLEHRGRRVVCNGEIYNHRQLRAAMEGRGHRFASDHSDTEVLLPLYHEHGPDMVDRLRGMFAFAVYDGPGRRLLLARDRMGQKPLYWTRTARHLAFASELKALLLVPGVARQIDPEGLHLYLQLGYVPAPRTIYRGVWKLPPAARLVVPLDETPRELVPQTYWSLPQPRSMEGRAPTDGLITEVREVLAEAVRLRLEADVPLGFFLSGGLDSSLVVALARQAEPRRPLRTFCMSFADARYDEARHAALVARHVSAEHARLIVRPGTLEELLPTIVAAFDEPFADSSALPTWLLAREARRHVTVALSGDGGDELFGGYDRYRAARMAALLDRAGPLKALVRVGGRLVPRGSDLKSAGSRWRRFTDALGLAPLERYARWVAPFHEADLLELCSARLREAAAPAPPGRSPATPGQSPAALEYLRAHLPPGGDFLDAVMALDARTYLPEDVLVKVDRMTMAHGLEVRSPLLDHKVVELAMGLPARLKLGPRVCGRRQKILLRQAARGLLPPRILRRRKMGFGVPLSAWLAGPAARFVQERLFDGPLADSGLVAGDVLARYVEEHILTECDHGPRLYSLLVLDEFLRRSGAKLSV